MSTTKSRTAPSGMDAALQKLTVLNRKKDAAQKRLNAELEKLAPLRESVAETEERIKKERERIKKFAIARKTRRYMSAHGMVELLDGRFKVDEVDLDVLDPAFTKREPKRAEILKWFKTHDNTAPAGATISRGEPSIKITL